MIAQFLQRCDVTQSGQTGFHFRFVQNIFLDRIGCNEAFVQRLLQFSHFHTNDHFEFDRQIFRENLIRSSYHILINDTVENSTTFVCFLSFLFRTAGILATKDYIFVLLFEVLLSVKRKLS